MSEAVKYLAIVGAAAAFWFGRTKLMKLGENMAYPGYETDDLDDLHPAMRGRVDELFQEMHTLGWSFDVRAVFRDQERQDFYKSKGWSTVNWSYHMASSAQERSGGEVGEPESLAVDVTPSATYSEDEQAGFYQNLMHAASSYGLQTGGTYSQRTDSPWSAYGLGWDPGHIEPNQSQLSMSAAREGDRQWG